MKFKNLNKTLLVAFMAVSLAACTNTNTPQPGAAANVDESAEVIVENSDIIDESIKEDSKNNSPADDKLEDVSSSKDQKADAGKTTIDVEKKEEKKDKEESSPEKSQEDLTSPSQKQENDNKESIDYQERDGVYVTNLVASQAGNRDPELALSSLADLKLENDMLTLEGSLDYLKDPNSYDNAEEYDKGVYSFKVTENTTFQAVGGMADPEIFTKEEFVDYYQGVKDSGLALKIEVKDGLVKTVSISS